MSIVTITGGGAFTSKNISDINANFASIGTSSTSAGEIDVWVRPSYGNDSNVGSYDKPFATISGCSRAIEPGIVIGVQGVITEEFAGPIVNDVTIVGFANQPRQATTSGVPNGGGATWLSPSSGSSDLLTIKGQGWKVQNLYFNNSTAAKADILVLISGGGDPPADPSGEQTQIIGCTFTGAKYGVLTSGGPNFLSLIGNYFFGFSDAGDTGVASITGAGVHSAYGWVIRGNRFASNAIHLDIASSGAEIAYNHFTYIDNLITTTTQVDLTGGKDASVYNNRFDVPFNVNGLSAMFVAGTNDRWAANTMGTAVLTPMTGVLWGIPVSGAA